MSNELTVVNTLTPDIWKMIQSVAKSSFDSRQFGIIKQGEADIKLLFCYENGLPLTAANTGLYIVKNKLAVQSNIIAAKLRMHPNYDYKIIEHGDDICSIEFLRRNNDGVFEVEGVSTFDKDDAQKAGLLSKDVWRNYPRNMYFGRAISNGQKWYAPDLFSQPIYIPEELGMRVDSDGSPIIEAEYTEIEKQMTLADLQSKYPIGDILTANDGKIPANEKEIMEVDKKLSEVNDGN